MSTIRFPKIGMITKGDDGSYEVDAIPGLEGHSRLQQTTLKYGLSTPSSLSKTLMSGPIYQPIYRMKLLHRFEIFHGDSRTRS